MAHGVPAAAAVGQAVRIELALGEGGLGRAIAEVNAAAGLGGGAERGQGRPVRGGGLAGQVQRHRVVGGAYPPAQVRGHHALELGLRPRDPGRGIGQAQAASGEEADGQGERLFVREHHGRQLVAGHEHVAAVAAMLHRDRDAQLLQARDVAAQRAAIHAQPGRELRSAQAAVGLQQLEGGQHPRGRVVHVLDAIRKLGRISPYIRPTVSP
jgi:hypothetical protein